MYMYRDNCLVILICGTVNTVLDNGTVVNGSDVNWTCWDNLQLHVNSVANIKITWQSYSTALLFFLLPGIFFCLQVVTQ